MSILSFDVPDNGDYAPLHITVDTNPVYPQPVVTFFDARYPDFGPHGQMISDYYLSDILNIDGGLDLAGSVSDWSVTAEAIAYVQHKITEGE